MPLSLTWIFFVKIICIGVLDSIYFTVPANNVKILYKLLKCINSKNDILRDKAE